MKKFEKPEMEVIVFEAEDIITQSADGYEQVQVFQEPSEVSIDTNVGTGE